MTNSQRQWLHSSVGYSVAPVSQGHGFKPRWSPEIFGLLYAIAKIAFITARIIASLDFISAVHIWSISYIISSLIIYTLRRMRELGVIMQVFLQIVAFSLQTDGSGRPVLTKRKRPLVRYIELYSVLDFLQITIESNSFMSFSTP